MLHKPNTLKLFSFGECMAEMEINSDLTAEIKFAGDTYNTLVYAKRWCETLDTSFISAMGTDFLSKQMRKHAATNQISLSWSLTSPTNNLGIYTISNTEAGASNFDYWRSTSAASTFFELAPPHYFDELLQEYEPGTMIYFTGVSVAIKK